MHCAKCMIRAKLWEAGAWPAQSELGTLAQAIGAQGGLGEWVEEMHALSENDKVTRLY